MHNEGEGSIAEQPCGEHSTCKSLTMWSIRNIALLALALGGSASAVSVEEGDLSIALMTKFKNWVDFHGKNYDSHGEKMKRLQIWLDNDGEFQLKGFIT